MPIVTSVIARDHAQVDGRRKITEWHTDHFGVVHERRYIADAGQDVEAGLAAAAQQIEEQLAAAELEANLQEIEGGI